MINLSYIIANTRKHERWKKSLNFTVLSTTTVLIFLIHLQGKKMQFELEAIFAMARIVSRHYHSTKSTPTPRTKSLWSSSACGRRSADLPSQYLQELV